MSSTSTSAPASSSSSTNEGLSAYSQGHHPSVLRSHASRTVQNSASHILPFIKKGMQLLDIGSGPGTITIGFSEFVGEEGKVIGLDPSESTVKQAQELAKEKGIKNVEFVVGNALERLEQFQDGEFDIVHAHQVLQHVEQPAVMLREMRRLVKSDGGIIALREADMQGPIIHPYNPLIHEEWLTIYTGAQRSNGGDPACARKLHQHVTEAGILPSEIIQHTAGTMSYGGAGPESEYARKWWGEMWAERTGNPESGTHKTAVEKGLASKEKLEQLAQTWKEWSITEGAWFVILNAELICHRGK